MNNVIIVNTQHPEMISFLKCSYSFRIIKRVNNLVVVNPLDDVIIRLLSADSSLTIGDFFHSGAL